MNNQTTGMTKDPSNSYSYIKQIIAYYFDLTNKQLQNKSQFNS